MRFKLALTGAGLFGVAAFGIRIAEYLYTLDGEGYYTTAPLAAVLSLTLTAVLAGAVLFLLGCSIGLYRKQADGTAICGNSPFLRATLSLLGAAVAVNGILLLIGRNAPLDLITALATLAGAIGFLGMANLPKYTDLFALLPPVWLCLQTVHYFFEGNRNKFNGFCFLFPILHL